MYVHPAFKATPETSEAFLAERGFGTLIALGDGVPVAAHVPFLYRPSAGGGVIELHVARANPVHALIAANPNVLLTCTGPDAYVSPDWYGSQNQVPTWNYVAVHATGQARIMDAAWLPGHLDELAAKFEAWYPKQPWTAAGMDQGRMSAMLNAIVGITIEVQSLEGNWKLGQHKGRPDHDGAVAGLRQAGDPMSAAVADLMDRSRNITRP
jgi:transcriptional regulator